MAIIIATSSVALLVVGGAFAVYDTLWKKGADLPVPDDDLAVIEEMPVPPSQQIPLILKVLTYDRNFEEQVGDELRVGIVHQPDPASVSAMDLILGAFEAVTTIGNVPISYARVAFTGAAALEAAARDGLINLFYITPGNSESIDELLEVSESLGILTTTGVPDYVERGVAVGIGTRGGAADSPQILINLPTSRSQGAEFDTRLLRLASDMHIYDDMPIAPAIQASAIIRVLEYDRNFRERAGDELRLALVYRPAEPTSVDAKNLMAAAFASVPGGTVLDVPLVIEEIPFSTAADLATAATASGTQVFYITPGHAALIDPILAVSAALGVLTTTGVPDYVQDGVAVGVGITGAEETQIVINLRTSQSEGADFPSALLRIARVIR